MFNNKRQTHIVDKCTEHIATFKDNKNE